MRRKQEKDYFKILQTKAKVYLAATESFPNPLGRCDILFLDRDFDRDVNFLFLLNLSRCGGNFIFLPEIMRNIDGLTYTTIDFYIKLREIYYDIYDDYFEALKLPEDFRFGIVCRCSEPCRVTNEDGTRTLMPGYICFSLSYEILEEFNKELPLLFEDTMMLIGEIDFRMRSLGERADEYVKEGVIDVCGLMSINCNCFERSIEEREAELIAAVEEYRRVTEETNRAYEKRLREYKDKKALIRLEYGRNYSTANKVSDESIVYAPKNYLVLHATRNNHITINLSPSQMALYCFIQTYKKYGVTKERLIEDINRHLGRYRKLCKLFCATHSDYDIPKVKVVVSQINRRIKTTLAEGNRSDEGQESFDFTPWTERLLIKSNERYLYYIDISDVRFRPVIVDENRRFVEFPDEYIDQL